MVGRMPRAASAQFDSNFHCTRARSGRSSQPSRIRVRFRKYPISFAFLGRPSSMQTAALAPIRPIALADVRDAQKRIAATIVRTPLVRLDLGPGYPDVRLELENRQPITASKLRAAAKPVAMLSESERRRGVWTISAGNAGQGVAYAARQAGVPCTVVAIETAPESKLERMRALGAKLILVSYDAGCEAR